MSGSTGDARRYHGWFGTNARRRCPHMVLIPIFGDMVTQVGGWRLQCDDCYQYLDGPVRLAYLRTIEAAEKFAKDGRG